MRAFDEFAALHSAGDPLVLFNVWDVGSAKAVAEAGARAIATGSASLAGAQGFADGEGIPFRALLATVRAISQAIDLPLSVDFETGFAPHAEGVAANAATLAEAGAIGCNLEDRLLDQDALREPADQADRIAAAAGAGLFVNARTDVFLGPLMAGGNPNEPQLVDAAIHRADIYAAAGARSFFAPGLSDPDGIARLCEAVALPVNIMRLPDMVSNAQLAALGVRRISYGPAPWSDAMERVREAAALAFGA